MAAELTAAAAPFPAFRISQEIGHRLCEEAIWHQGSCTWLGDETDASGAVIHRSMAGDLYAGTSGIGWFLAHLWRSAKDEVLGETAAGALRHANAQADASDAGLYTGLAGIALASVVAGSILGDDEIVSAGARAARRAAASASNSTGSDLISGQAGLILSLLQLAPALGDDGLEAVAVTLGDRLLASASRTPIGWAWAGANPNEPPLCGLGHGASGVALALAELGAASGHPRFLEGAQEALLYERGWFNREEGNWPDLRELDWSRIAGGGRPSYLTYWCHGAAGIGLARLKIHERAEDRTALAEAAAAIDTATAAILRAVSTTSSSGWGYEKNLSLCHGVGSVVELHVTAAGITGDDDHLGYARRLAQSALSGRGDRKARFDESPFPSDVRALVHDLPCGVFGGGETPGLMLGLAGVGAAFLRLSEHASIPSPLLVTEWTAMS